MRTAPIGVARPVPTITTEHDARIAQATFASIQLHDLDKVEKTDRTRDEPHQETGFHDDRPHSVARRHTGPGDGRDHLVRRSRP